MPDTIGRSQVKARTLASKTVRYDPFIACLMLVPSMNVRMPSLTDEGGFRRSYLRRGYHQKMKHQERTQV